MDISSSSRKSDDSTIINVNIVPTIPTTSTPNEFTYDKNKNEITTDNNNIVNISSETLVSEFPQPAITRNPQSHNNPSIITPPEHNKDTVTIITTQPLPRAMQNPSNNNRFSTANKFCKICQEPEEFVADPGIYNNEGKLISPCKCKGSLQYVHIGCLNKWRHSNVRLEASYRCEVCKYEYKFYRPRIAKIISSGFTLHFLSITLLFSMVYLVSYLVKLAMHNKVHKNIPSDEDRWQDTMFLNLRAIEFIIGISIVSSFGLIFFIFLICFNGFTHTRQNYLYCGGCSYGCYGCYGGGCGAGNADCDGFIGLFLLIIVVIFGFICVIITTYLFTQKIITIGLEKFHDRILDVKKD